jgi:ribosomal protein S18 acetylase RimI-like enzyme
MLLTMVTTRTLPSGDGPDDATSRGRVAVRGGRVARRLGLLDPVVLIETSDPAAGPAASGTGPASPPVTDVTSLVIDLTDALRPDPGSADGFVSRPVGIEDLARLAAIHAEQLPEGFFVRFGLRFLTAYHRTFLVGPHAIALSVGPLGAPLGFVVGTWDNPRHYRWLARNAGPLVRSGLLALSVRPSLAYRLVRTRGGRYARSVFRLLRHRAASAGASRRAGSAEGGATDGPAATVAVLTHVAVAPHAQGTGLGRVLVEAFVAHVRTRGADEIRLIAHLDTPAPGFYRRLGWSSLGERTASDGSLVEEFRSVP